MNVTPIIAIIAAVGGILSGLAIVWSIFKRPERKYTYMCSYHHKNGLGTAIMNCCEKIRTRDDVVKLQHDIESQCELEHVGLINYILLKR
jgi:hypothetical protein